MDRTKAEFRALRETVGMTQGALAGEMGVQIRSVKRWENPDAPQEPPEEAWEVLDDAIEAQRRVVSYTLGKVDEIAEKRGDYPKAVAMPYWACSADYKKFHTVPDGGDWRMANANLRLISFALHEKGIKVVWTDRPSDDEGSDSGKDKEPREH